MLRTIRVSLSSFLRLGMDDEEEEVVPLPNVNSAILKKVIQWATYHKDDPPPLEDDENKEKRTDDISSWDADFLKVDQGTLFELILVSLSISKLFVSDMVVLRYSIILIFTSLYA